MDWLTYLNPATTEDVRRIDGNYVACQVQKLMGVEMADSLVYELLLAPAFYVRTSAEYDKHPSDNGLQQVSVCEKNCHRHKGAIAQALSVASVRP